MLCTIILLFTDEPEMLGGSVKVCTLGIEGMTCHSCVSLIESTVGEMKGVVKVTVSLAERQGTVEYDSALVTPEEIRNTVKDMGFIVAGVTGIECSLIPRLSIRIGTRLSPSVLVFIRARGEPGNEAILSEHYRKQAE